MYKYLWLYVAGIIETSVSKILENPKEIKNGEIRRHFKDPVNSFMVEFPIIQKPAYWFAEQYLYDRNFRHERV